ncbi:MAG: 16S rRNA (adenine(1518)-N(6)/adenine(1519)-N(6))-dimethyltransferase RsmA, partial [Thermoguttaceae bacterium]
MPEPSGARQTQSFLRKRFAEIGIQPRAKLGQNFLIDLNLQRSLVDAANLQPSDVVLEVGTGTGSLTALMAPRVASVVTIEIDANLYALAGEELSQFDNVRRLQFDVLKNKNHLAPELLEILKAELDAQPGRTFKLAANLPYSVATPLMSNLLMLDWAPLQMTVTIQKELADRMTARPKTKDYSALSVWMQSQCRTEILRVMSPTVFWPRPKVTSAIVQVTLDPARRDRIVDRPYFHRFTR